MKKAFIDKKIKIIAAMLYVLVSTMLAGCSAEIVDEPRYEDYASEVEYVDTDTIDYDGFYDSVEDVSLYVHIYGELPANYITKKEAQELGWSGGSLEDYAPGKCIGGSYFGNYEGILPTEDIYTECDIDTMGAESRGAERIVFSNDGDIYYTEDHYETFILLYTEDGPVEGRIVFGD